MIEMMRLTYRNYFKLLGAFRCTNHSLSWSQVRWCLLSLKKACSVTGIQQSYCFNTGIHHVEDVSKRAIKHNDAVFPSDMVKVKAMPFNLVEGGNSIVGILNKSTASVVVIFVRTSALANELATELKENNFNAVAVDKFVEFDKKKIRQNIFVISDKMSAMQVSLPPADLLIQVQAPLCGVDGMKQRLSVKNFTHTNGEAVVLCNSNDAKFVEKLADVAEVINANSLLPHVSEENEKITRRQELDKAMQLSLHESAEKAPAVLRKVKTTLFKPVYPDEKPKRKSVYSSFVDKVRLYVIGGSGGNGSPRSGARGGDGGDVILECRSKATLNHFRFKENRRPKAGHGQHSCKEAKRMNGKRGEDLIIPVPPGTIVMDESGRVMADMTELGRQVKVVSGGRGGSSLTTAGGGEKGEKRTVILEYKMCIDVGFIGFPNAGKSTLLWALSKARPKVSEHAFTSLQPTLGRMALDDLSQLTLADLPGLIEGAHQNRGLGLRFLRHIERARILLFVVDVNGFQLSSKLPERTAFETICLLAKEISLYKEAALYKPKILVVNKMDCAGAEEEYFKLKEELQNWNRKECETLPLGMKLGLPEDFRFHEVFAISASNQTGIDKVMVKLRELVVKE